MTWVVDHRDHPAQPTVTRRAPRIDCARVPRGILRHGQERREANATNTSRGAYHDDASSRRSSRSSQASRTSQARSGMQSTRASQAQMHVHGRATRPVLARLQDRLRSRADGATPTTIFALRTANHELDLAARDRSERPTRAEFGTELPLAPKVLCDINAWHQRPLTRFLNAGVIVQIAWALTSGSDQ
mgnify:CR=1 FL=1